MVLQPPTPAVTGSLEHGGAADPTVLVVLPVFNGARFLMPQVESVFAQVDVRVHVLCRDDGSTDDSPDVLRSVQRRWPRHVSLVEDRLGNLGASGSFSLLMQRALEFRLPDGGPVEYVALCDQDDLWHPRKLSTCLFHLRRLERAAPGRPAVVHSDLRVIGAEGGEIAASLARYQGLRVDLPGFAAQLLSNTLTGCTSLMNRALMETALPVPSEAIMHDWWLSLVASGLGTRLYLEQPLVDYRQHAGNTIGAKPHDEEAADRGLLRRLFVSEHGAVLRQHAGQARAVLRRLGSALTRRQRLAAWLVTLLRIPSPVVHDVVHRLVRRL